MFAGGYIATEIPIYSETEPLEEYILENYPILRYLLGGGAIIGIVGIASITAGTVSFLQDRKKDVNQLRVEELARGEWTKKRGIFRLLGLGNVLAGILVLGFGLYYGIPPSEIGFFVVSDEYTGILDIGSLSYSAILFVMGYVILFPIKNARKIVIILAIAVGLVGLIVLIQGHILGILGISVLIETCCLVRNPYAVTYFEGKKSTELD